MTKLLVFVALARGVPVNSWNGTYRTSDVVNVLLALTVVVVLMIIGVFLNKKGPRGKK